MKKRLWAFWQSRWIQAGFSIAWALAILLLPITSLPALGKMSGGSIIAPPSVLFFVGLALAWLAPYIAFSKRLPPISGLLFLFLISAGISWAGSFFLPISPFRGHMIQTEFREIILSLFILLSVYLTTVAWVSQSPGRVRTTLQLVSISGLVLVLWSLLQAMFVLFLNGIYPRLIYQLQDLISSRQGDILFPDRVTGMAYEPSWLAHQLVIIYLPLWLSASIMRYSAFRQRLGWFSLENVLLLGGVLVLFMSFSRIGWLSFLLTLAVLLLKFNLDLIRSLRTRLKIRYTGGSRFFYTMITSTGVFLGFGLVYLGAIIGLVWLGSRLEPRLARILAGDLTKIIDVYDLSNRLFFAERLVYWSAGWDVFGKYPWFGVGLGNAGFFFPQTMPSFGYGLTEIRNIFNYFTFLPNTKSMWVRLLAETGMVGFSVFLTWLFILFQSARVAVKIGTQEIRVLGWMGILVLTAYLLEGFSLDSFSMPYFWFSLGLIGASASLALRNHQDAQIGTSNLEV